MSVALDNQFLITLRKILLCNWLYYILCLIALGYFLIATVLLEQSSVYTNETEFIGTITNYRIDGNILNIDLKADEKLKATYLIRTEEEKDYLENNIKLGIKIKIIGSLELPLNNTIPNTFNYRKFLYNQQIFWTVRISNLEIISHQTNIFFTIKNSIQSRVERLEKGSGYVSTFILGDRTYLDAETFRNYQQNGIGHLFALSGMHINLFAALIIFLLKKIKIGENKRYLIAISFILSYAALTNFTASMLRAGLFFTLLKLNTIFFTHVKTINILLLTGAMLTFINPFILYNIGFQYSFTVTFGLVLSSNKFKTKNYFNKIFIISLIAFLFSIPISLNNFYEINFFALINNLFFVPIVSFILYPLSLIVFIFPFLDNFLALIARIVESINNLATNIHIFSVIFPKMPLYMALIYYFFLILSIKNKKLIFKIMIVLILIWSKYKVYLDSTAHICFLDVGQGNSVIIRAPHNKETIMVDTGGRFSFPREEWQKRRRTFNLSDNTLLFLKSIGISKIDNLVLTHGHEDHLGEALNILSKFRVDNIIFNHGDINPGEQAIIDKYSHKNITFNQINSNMNIISLNNNIYNDENDDSLVLLITIYNYSILLTGDITKRVEEDIISQSEFTTNLVLLAHHGSRTSSSPLFLSKINPDIAIISAGRNNMYNHPNRQTMETLYNLKINYYSTQNEGTICLHISYDAHNFSFQRP